MSHTSINLAFKNVQVKAYKLTFGGEFIDWNKLNDAINSLLEIDIVWSMLQRPLGQELENYLNLLLRVGDFKIREIMKNHMCYIFPYKYVQL